MLAKVEILLNVKIHVILDIYLVEHGDFYESNSL